MINAIRVFLGRKWAIIFRLSCEKLGVTAEINIKVY